MEVDTESESFVSIPNLLEFDLERTSTRRVRSCEISTGTYDHQIVSLTGRQKTGTHGLWFESITLI